MEIYFTPNKEKNGITITSEYQKARFMDWLKKYNAFKIEPVVEESSLRRRYLEGAVIPAYCRWQYGIDPREPGQGNKRRDLFMKDFNFEIVTNRDGEPAKVALSSRGLANDLLNDYTQYAEQNGAPIPNPELYKNWRDNWSMDIRFKDFYEWLNFLGLEEDAMPSAETLEKLREDTHG